MWDSEEGVGGGMVSDNGKDNGRLRDSKAAIESGRFSTVKGSGTV